MGVALNRGFNGEQTWGFILGQQGYEFIDGPSGSGGHAANASGFDGVAYNPKTGDLILGDNKTFRRVGNVTSATAIDPAVNLEKNLQRMIRHIETEPNLARFPNRDTVLQWLRSADRALTQWKAAGRPAGRLNLGGVRLVVFNARGNSTGVGGKLGRSGAVHFQDVNAPPQIRVATEPARIRVATEPPRVRVVTEAEIHTPARILSGRRAVVGGLAKMVGPAVALGILHWGMKEAMAKNLENLKQPQPDPRDAPNYLSDPNTAGSIRFLDLLNKNLKPFGSDLAQHHAGVIANANVQVMLLAGSRNQSIEERLEFVSALRDELLDYGNELDVVYENLETAKGLSAKVEAAAQGAEQLSKAFNTLWGKDQLMKAGVNNDDVFGAPDTLSLADRFGNFSFTARRVIRDVEELHTRVGRMRDELSSMYWQLLRVSWFILLTPLLTPTSPDPKRAVSQGSLRVYEAMGPGTPSLRLSQIKERVKHHPGDFVPSVETALKELSAAGKVQLMESRGVIIEAWRNQP